MSGWSLGARAALVAGSLLAGGVGWFAAHSTSASGAPGSAEGAVDLFSCPLEGAQSIGQLAAGDDVWLMGITDSRWAVIRHPDAPGRPAWVPLAMIATDADTGDLPRMGCDANPSTGTTSPPTTAPPTTIAGAPTTTSTTTTSTTTTSTLPPTTLPFDSIPPTVTLTANRDHLYVAPANACPDEAELEVTIIVADPTLPLTIRSVIANWTSPTGPQSVGLTPIAGNRFRLVIDANGPVAFELPVTITATAADGAGNVGAGTVGVALRNPANYGCA